MTSLHGRRFWAGLFAGVLFGVGLLMSGMTQPSKVAGFLDIGGMWDPSLGFVMGGAIAVYAIGAFLLRNSTAALFGDVMEKAPKASFDFRLLGGSALFGIGWGMSGYCPGPALVSALSFDPGLLVFLTFMSISMIVYNRYLRP